MTVAQICWCVAIVAFLLLELATPSMLVSIWLMIGAICALLITLVTPVVWIQLLTFAIVSALTLVYTRPLLVARARQPFVPTNADRLVGAEAIVVQAITPQRPGRVEIQGVSWAARADEELPEGASCQVTDIAGATLQVSAVCEQVPQA